jgi:sialic acid synthase SpsE
MQAMVRACQNVHMAMGGAARVLSVKEEEQISKMRRSMVSVKDLPVGTVLAWEHIEFKRPGNGISPADYEQYMGRTVRVPIERGCVILPNSLDGVGENL